MIDAAISGAGDAQLLVYFSADEGREKYVCLALEMEASKKEEKDSLSHVCCVWRTLHISDTCVQEWHKRVSEKDGWRELIALSPSGIKVLTLSAITFA